MPSDLTRSIRIRSACILILVREEHTVENNNAMLGKRREQRAVIATAREVRLKRGCFERRAGQSHPGPGEHLKKRPRWLNVVVPTICILVSNCRENRNARKMLLKFKSEELDSLRGECSICDRIGVTRPGRKLLVLRSPVMRQTVSGVQDKLRMRNGLGWQQRGRSSTAGSCCRSRDWLTPSESVESRSRAHSEAGCFARDANKLGSRKGLK